jgi:PAS domain S-box-containing protein
MMVGLFQSIHRLRARLAGTRAGALGQANQSLRLTQFSVDKSADAVFWVWPNGDIKYVNESACKNLGYTRAELLGMSICDLDPFFPREVWASRWQENMRRGPQTIESFHKRKDGSLMPVEISINLTVVDGQEWSFTFVRDITLRRQALDELSKSHNLLEQRVAERTAELVEANAQLRRAQMDMVQGEKMGMLGQLVAGIAHEINTPTGAILNVMGDVRSHLIGLQEAGVKSLGLPPAAQVWLAAATGRVLADMRDMPDAAARGLRRQAERELRQGGFPDPARSAAVLVRCFGADWNTTPGALENLRSDIVRDLLDHLTSLKAATDISLASVQKIARIVRALRYYSHSSQDEMANVNMNECLDNTMVILHNRLKHVAEVRTTFAPDLPEVCCGPDISQVWTNILNNACDAIEENHPGRLGVIEVATRADGGQVVVEIANDGPPIPEPVTHKMYDPFYTTKPVGKGTGLGLGICVGILARSGGTISARNDPGKVVFTVTLPSSAVAVPAPRQDKVVVC